MLAECSTCHDYSIVKIHKREYLWLGIQFNNTIITPDGGMYMNKRLYCDDYTLQEFELQRVFMHEMVHVWQHQLGYPVLWKGLNRLAIPYEYTLSEKKLLSHYNMEAQGDLLSDYWAICTHPGDYELAITQKKHVRDILLFTTVLQLFLKNPADRRNLPKGHKNANTAKK